MGYDYNEKYNNLLKEKQQLEKEVSALQELRITLLKVMEIKKMIDDLNLPEFNKINDNLIKQGYDKDFIANKKPIRQLQKLDINAPDESYEKIFRTFDLLIKNIYPNENLPTYDDLKKLVGEKDYIYMVGNVYGEALTILNKAMLAIENDKVQGTYRDDIIQAHYINSYTIASVEDIFKKAFEYNGDNFIRNVAENIRALTKLYEKTPNQPTEEDKEVEMDF